MENMSLKSLIAIIGTVLFVIAFIILWPFTTISTGERGIVLHFNAFQGEVLDQGLHWRTPITMSVVKMNVQVQAVSVEASAASKDLNNVATVLTLNYHVDPAQVGSLYQNIGVDYPNKVIAPALQEAIKSTTAKYTAEELITKREMVKTDALLVLRERLAKSFIVVDDLSITDFDFSPSFNAAIEAKVTAEQDALASKNKLEQVKYEAQQQIETAKASAESIRIQGEAITNNPALVQLKWVEKWDGAMPTYQMGAGVPLINIPAYAQ